MLDRVDTKLLEIENTVMVYFRQIFVSRDVTMKMYTYDISTSQKLSFYSCIAEHIALMLSAS